MIDRESVEGSAKGGMVDARGFDPADVRMGWCYI